MDIYTLSGIFISVILISLSIGLVFALIEGPKACETINGEWPFLSGGFGTYPCNIIEDEKLTTKIVTKYKGKWIEVRED